MDEYSIELVEWQQDCLENIHDKSHVILSSPTGSGKTIIYEEWAFNKMERPIFITSPIKSLSNQRFRELTARGYKVGLETGDIHYLPYENPDIICCTQEIYNNKYRDVSNSTLIIDEFSYIFKNISRARCYIDSIVFSKAKNIMICSATLGNSKEVKEYLDRITGGYFYLYENNDRLTSLEYRDEISINDIRNSLVVAYSVEDCKEIALKLYEYRCNLSLNESVQDCNSKIMELARKYNIRNNELIELSTKGVVYYYGRLYPKEKLFIEELFERRLIDTVVGTDALALGVNFPIGKVIFTSFVKRDDNKHDLISKDLFLQLSGRAGRKKYFNNGYVYWCSAFAEENKEKIRNSYQKLLMASLENFTIDIRARIENILLGRATVEEEALYVVNYSTKGKCYEEERNKIQSIIDFITTLDITSYMIKRIYNIDISSGFHGSISGFNEKFRKKIERLSEELFKLQPIFEKDIARVYFEEYSCEENCDLFIEILLGTSLGMLIKRYCGKPPEVDMRKLTQLRKYLKHLPPKYLEGYNLAEIDEFIDMVDPTVLHPYGEARGINSDDLEEGYSTQEIWNNIFGNNKLNTSLKKNTTSSHNSRKKKNGNYSVGFDLIMIDTKVYVKLKVEDDKILLCDYSEVGSINLYQLPLRKVIYTPVGRISYKELEDIWPRVNSNSLSETLDGIDGNEALATVYKKVLSKKDRKKY